jgi:hypothetical protein
MRGLTNNQFKKRIHALNKCVPSKQKRKNAARRENSSSVPV